MSVGQITTPETPGHPTGPCSEPVNTEHNWCTSQPWEPYEQGRSAGDNIFVWTNCATREPLDPEHQDPVFRYPNVPLDRGLRQTAMQSWVKNKCAYDPVYNEDGSRKYWVFNIQGKGFADNQIGLNGEGLRGPLENCGLGQFNFAWTLGQDYDWGVVGSTVKGGGDCIGFALLKAGGAHVDQCQGS